MRDEQGRLDRSLVPEARSQGSFDVTELPLNENMPAIWDQHCILGLTDGEAKALQRELSRVFERYYHPDTTNR